MTSQSLPQTNNSEFSSNRPEDTTGRDKIALNVLFSWAAQLVFIVSGFILPRMIDRRLGQDILGVWDFSWSLITYFGLVQFGIASSVNRYVARYHAANDIINLNKIVTSACFLLGISGLVVCGLTVVFTLLLPVFFGNRLGVNLHEAQWVVFFLGISIAFQMAFTVFGGVLTGCHRWGFHNINKSGWYAITVGAMIVALLIGGKLWHLALIVLVGEILTDIRKMILAYRVCDGLKIKVSFIERNTLGQLFVFGGKTLIPSISNLLLNQTTSILVLAYLGPSALALFSRPNSLVHRIDQLVAKMGMILTPTTSSLQSINSTKKIRELAISSARYSLYLSLPIALVMIIFGNAIMQFWMGERYANSPLPAILAIGNLAVLVHLPALNILAGLNAHGRAGLGRFVASLFSVILNLIVLKYLKWGLVGTAIAVTLPLTILNLVDIPLLMCKRVELDIKKYFISVVSGPVLHTLPFTICLVIARFVFHNNPLKGFFWGGSIGSIILTIIYWKYVLPESIKARLSFSKLLTYLKIS